MAKITIEIDDADLWSEIFGSGFESYPWWDEVDYLAGDWETPGVVGMRLMNPDRSHVASGLVTVYSLARAASEVLQTYPHQKYVLQGMDAELADMILQTAVAGRVIFG